MRSVVLLCLGLCAAVALAGPVGTSIAVSASPSDVLIDVTSEFVDSQMNQQIFQVVMNVEHRGGQTVAINGQLVQTGEQITVQCQATFREVLRNSNQVLSARQVNVAAQTSVTMSPAGDSVSVQLYLSALDGNQLDEMMVHEVVMFLKDNKEVHRQVSLLPLPSSRITTTAAPDAEPQTGETGNDTTGDSDDSDSSSEVSSGDKDKDDHHFKRMKWHCHKFFSWMHKRPFIVRVLIYAAMAFIALLVFKIVFCWIAVCCCGVKKRTTQVDGVKLQYMPLSMNDVYDEKEPLPL